MSYSLKDFEKDFPNDVECVEFIFDAMHSRDCSCGGRYAPLFQWDSDARKLVGRRQFQCSKCRHQIAPTAGTIFHKSDTSLRTWFHAVRIVASSKSGVSASQLQRELGVYYKVAYRISAQIRKALRQDTESLSGIVEIDTAYIGGRFRSGEGNKKQKQIFTNKAVIYVAIERSGRLRAIVADDNKADNIQKFVRENIAKGTLLLTDKAHYFDSLEGAYMREAVNHKAKEYVRGKAHVNTVETWFSHFKRSLKGTFKTVSKDHLQSYLDVFAFHYNNRHNDRARFASLLGTVLQPSE